jgi:hypothetical protein
MLSATLSTLFSKIEHDACVPIVFNGGTGFVVNNGLGTGPARFIFAGEDGTTSKGLATDSTTAGKLLYATDFHNGRVDVFDSTFTPVHTPGAFVDPRMQKGRARSLLFPHLGVGPGCPHDQAILQTLLISLAEFWQMQTLSALATRSEARTTGPA